MLKNFSQSSILSLGLAAEEARASKQCSIRDIDLLLGVAGISSGIAAQVLAFANVDTRQLRSAISDSIPCGQIPVQQDLPFASEALLAIQQAWMRCRNSEVTITTGHLLLSLIGHRHIIEVFMKLAIDLDLIAERTNKAFKDTHVVSQEDSINEPDRFGTFYGFLSGDAFIALTLAEREARKTGHAYVDSGHILLGCLFQQIDTPLKGHSDKISLLNELRKEIFSITGEGSGWMPQVLPFTAQALRILESALQEARKTKADITTQKILIALTQDHKGVASRALQKLGIELIL